MSSNGLWKPSKQDKANLKAGYRKERLHCLRKSLADTLCPFCGRDILMKKDGSKFYTLGGSEHKCKGMGGKEACLT